MKNEETKKPKMKVLADYYLPDKRIGYVDKKMKTIKCPYCGEIHNINYEHKNLNSLNRMMIKTFGTTDIDQVPDKDIMDTADRIDALKLQSELMTLKCPSCGKIPSRIKDPGHFDSGITRYKAVLNGEVLHLRVVYSQRYTFPETRNVKVKPYIFELCVNLRTGITYEAPVHSIGRKFRWYNGNRTEFSFRLLKKNDCKLIMATSRPLYRFPVDLSCFFSEEMGLIEILENLGYNVDILKMRMQNSTICDKKECISAKDISEWNYNKNINPQIAGPYRAEIENCFECGIQEIKPAYRKQYTILRLHDKNNTLYSYINNVCKRRKLGKRIKKLFYLDWRTMCLQKRLSEIGIKDQNYVYQILTSYESIKKLPGIIWDETNNKFLARFDEKKAVKILTNYLESTNTYIYNDVVRMCDSCVRLNSSEEEIKECLKGSNIKEIHDNLSTLYDVKSRENIEIKYTPYEYSLEDNINGYQFRLAPDTLTLRDTGRRMNICVGSYDQRALSKESTIVTAKKDGKPEMCIELAYDAQSKKYKGYQFKGNCNHILIDNAAKAMIDWVKKHNVESEKCYDYIQANIEYEKYISKSNKQNFKRA